MGGARCSVLGPSDLGVMAARTAAQGRGHSRGVPEPEAGGGPLVGSICRAALQSARGVFVGSVPHASHASHTPTRVQVLKLIQVVPRSTTSWEAFLTPLWWSIAPNRLKSPVFAPAALRGTRFGLESRAVRRKIFAKSGSFWSTPWHYYYCEYP